MRILEPPGRNLARTLGWISFLWDTDTQTKRKGQSSLQSGEGAPVTVGSYRPEVGECDDARPRHPQPSEDRKAWAGTASEAVVSVRVLYPPTQGLRYEDSQRKASEASLQGPYHKNQTDENSLLPHPHQVRGRVEL